MIVLGKQIYLKHGESFKTGRSLKYLAGPQGQKYFKMAIGGLFKAFCADADGLKQQHTHIPINTTTTNKQTNKGEERKQI